MSQRRSHADDLRGAAKLAVVATTGITDIVEEMHQAIASGPALLGRPLARPVRALTRVMYGPVRGVATLVGDRLDRALAEASALLGASTPGAERDAVVAALNGVVGDYLEATANPLATRMELRAGGHVLTLTAEGLRAALPNATGKVLVLVHGLSMNDRQWCRAGHDHGAALARDLGYTPVYVRYNSGRHISTNGLELAAQLEALTAAWPVPLTEISLLGHSMGGLLARSTCHAATAAAHTWPAKLRRLVCLGSPHHGSPIERGGNLVDVLLGVTAHSAPLARLGKIRSAGVTDVRWGNVVDEDWCARERFAPGEDRRRGLPLPEGVACFAIAGTLSREATEALRGDGLVPVASALGRHERAHLALAFPEAHRWVALGTGHVELLSSEAVYAQLRTWFSD